MCSTCCPFRFLQGFKKILETFFKIIERAHIYMTWITIDNVQRVVTHKAGKSELRFLSFANYIMVIYICLKFKENILDSFQVTEWTQIHYYFQSSKGRNSKSRLTKVTVLHLVS